MKKITCKLAALVSLQLLIAIPAFAQVVGIPPVVGAPVASGAVTRQVIKTRQLNSIDFGAFTSEQAGGTITISPTGLRTSTGRITFMSATTTGPSEFDITGQPNEMIIISLPDRVTLGVNGSGGNVVLTNLTLSSGQSTLMLDAQGRARVKVGGTLQVPGAAAPGAYSGLFDIDVRYAQ